MPSRSTSWYIILTGLAHSPFVHLGAHRNTSTIVLTIHLIGPHGAIGNYIWTPLDDYQSSNNTTRRQRKRQSTRPRRAPVNRHDSFIDRTSAVYKSSREKTPKFFNSTTSASSTRKSTLLPSRVLPHHNYKSNKTPLPFSRLFHFHTMEHSRDSVFPRFADGDVVIAINTGRVYQLHSGTLRRHSTFFTQKLLEGHAAQLSTKARKEGVVIRFRFDLMRSPLSECGELVMMVSAALRLCFCASQGPCKCAS